ncbi:MAG: DUF2752 domain-containing protein [Dorea sp.]
MSKEDHSLIKLLIKDIKAAGWAILLVIAYLVFLKDYLYSLCPLKMILGIPCPGCGMTRAVFRVLHLDFIGAWKYHPFIYPIILIFLLFCWERYILRKKDMKLVKRIIIGTAVAMCIFYIYRMIRYFPDTTPMLYYQNNVLNRIWSLLH